jgi:hypothetical protein
VPYEHVVFDGHAFADEGMAGNFATPAHFSVLLYFNERADLCFVADFATVKIDEFREPDFFAKLHIWGNAAEFIHS